MPVIVSLAAQRHRPDLNAVLQGTQAAAGTPRESGGNAPYACITPTRSPDAAHHAALMQP